ncbi:hypothetical protein BN2537_12847 [Streptomyces venezuelae]|nr:hypothetical protein BN2537_12847 [Streptomyces venezuelae]
MAAALLFVAAALPPLFDPIHGGASLPGLATTGRRPTPGLLFARLGRLAPSGDRQDRAAQHDEESHHADPDLLCDHSGHEERDTHQEAGDCLVNPSAGVRTQPASLERCRELGIFGVQRSLHLLEHSLLVLRERHGVLLVVGRGGDRFAALSG